MAAGQALDMTVMNNRTISDDVLLEIYHLKTGALFTASIELGRLSANENNERHAKPLHQFAEAMGLAFQIQDDILDIEGSSEELGKPQGADYKHNKFTYPSIHGLPQAKHKVEKLYEAALESINYLGQSAQLLRDLTTNLLSRKK